MSWNGTANANSENASISFSSFFKKMIVLWMHEEKEEKETFWVFKIQRALQ